MASKVDEPEAHAALRTKLYENCVGSGNPSQTLLDRGVFPKNWVGQYKALLRSVQKVWADDSQWPRDVVIAVHFASMHLPIRYEAWSIGSGATNQKTLELLRQVRIPSELFPMSHRFPDAGEAI